MTNPMDLRTKAPVYQMNRPLILRRTDLGYTTVCVCGDGTLQVKVWYTARGEPALLTDMVTLTPLEFGVCLGLMEQTDIVDPVLRRLAAAEASPPERRVG